MVTIRLRGDAFARWAPLVVAAALSACAATGRGAAPAASPPGVARPESSEPAKGGAAAAEDTAANLDPREERRLTKELGRDVDDYYRLLREKNLDGALAYVDPRFQKGFLDELWAFTAAYTVEGIQALNFQFRSQADGLSAKVKVARTLFQKTSVVPERSEVSMTWVHRGNRWLFQPTEKK